MATTTIDATLQGIVSNEDVVVSVDWSAERNAATGTGASTYTTATDFLTAMRSRFSIARGGEVYSIARTYLFFDLDPLPGTVTAATLKVLAINPIGTPPQADTIVIESTAWGGDGSTTTLGTGDFGDVDFSTPFSSQKTTWTDNAYNDYTLNASAIESINADSYLNVAVVEHDYDYSNVQPANGVEVYNGVRFLDATNKIKLELTYTPGYGNDVIGVASANIDNVIGVASANISTIIGV